MKYGTLIRLAAPKEAEAKMKLLRDYGMDSCQLVYKPEMYRPEDADPIRQAAEAYGIEISAQFCGYRDPYYCWDTRYDYINAGINSPLFGESRIQYILSAIPFMQRLGVTDMILHAGFIPNDPFEPAYARMLSAVAMIAGHLKRHGMNLLFETGTESPIALLRLIEEAGCGNLYVNLDTGNLIMYGYGNPVDAMTTFGRYVRNTHFKDGLPPTVPGKIGPEVKYGTGNVDFPKVVQLLKAQGYDRYITIEREITGEQQGKDITEALTKIKTLWDTAQ